MILFMNYDGWSTSLFPSHISATFKMFYMIHVITLDVITFAAYF